MIATKTCSKCNETKPLTEFHKKRTVKSGLRAECKSCAAAYQREYAAAHKKEYAAYQRQYCARQGEEGKTQRTDYRLQRTYGIALTDYNEMLKAQSGCCAICGRTPEKQQAFVDHDHETGEIRGLLCSNCNTAVGLLQDSPSLMRKAALYVEQGRQ